MHSLFIFPYLLLQEYAFLSVNIYIYIFLFFLLTDIVKIINIHILVKFEVVSFFFFLADFDAVSFGKRYD